jgi:hypothetical protein
MNTYTQNLYSLNGNYPDEKPTVVLTAENTTFNVTPDISDEVLESHGYKKAPDRPDIVRGQVVLWDGSGWLVELKTEVERKRMLERQWVQVRRNRDQLLQIYDWRYLRNGREQRLGVPTTDNIQELDAYAQALADITNQPDPYSIVWPAAPESFSK